MSVMKIIVIAHNIRSTHNIGSILRTSDGLGVTKVFCTGYTPYPTLPNDERLPHMRDKLTKQINKTALGAEKTVSVRHSYELGPVLTELKSAGYQLVALEQSPDAVMLPDFTPKGDRVALLLGEEVHGIPAETLKRFDATIEIPMHGKKESFNVSVAAGIALYSLNHM
jgi:23S rRNA (guanosine2251-2'-O)-methyltransferase